MMDKRYNKYSNGESLSETLVAALIISLAMIMLFSGAKVGTDIMGKSKAEYKTYFDNLNAYEVSQAAYVAEYKLKYPTEITPITNYTFTIDPKK
ncbi:MAG: hypothetical protein IK128_08160 [Clostridiales bacterium]|nr:hypothetical protein [Clostridiales bacterium]